MVMMDIFHCLGVDHICVDMVMGMVMVLVVFRWWGGGCRGRIWSEEGVLLLYMDGVHGLLLCRVRGIEELFLC